MEMKPDELYSNILSILVDNLALQKATADLLISHVSNGDKKLSEKLTKDLNDATGAYRKTIIAQLSAPERTAPENTVYRG